MIEERQQNWQFFQTHVIDFHRPGQFALLNYGTVQLQLHTCVFQRGQRNNHACTYKFTRLQIKHA